MRARKASRDSGESEVTDGLRVAAAEEAADFAYDTVLVFGGEFGVEREAEEARAEVFSHWKIAGFASVADAHG